MVVNNFVTLAQLDFSTVVPPANWTFKNNFPCLVRLYSRKYHTDNKLKFEFTITPGETKTYSTENLRWGDEILAYTNTGKDMNELLTNPYVLLKEKPYVVIGDILSTEINDVTVRGHEHTVTPFLKVQNECLFPLNVFENRKLVAVIGRNQIKEDDSSVVLRGDQGIPRGVRYDFQDQISKKTVGSFVTNSPYVRNIKVGVINGYASKN